MLKFILTIICLVYSLQVLAIPEVPDARETPGTLCTVQHQDFKEYRYSEKIPYCQRNVRSSLKRQIYENYGVKKECRGSYTIDHFIPLSLGGDNEPTNLWPEHKIIKASRQNLEYNLYLAIRKGEITQAEAVGIIYEEKMNPDLPPDWQNQARCKAVLRPLYR